MKTLIKWSLTASFVLLCMLGVHVASAKAADTLDDTEELAPANPDSKTYWEGTPYVTDTTSTNNKLRASSVSNPVIVDISHHQGTIDWSKASKVIDLAIIRTQYGSQLEDRKHKEYEAGAIKYGVPFGVYAYHLATDEADAKVEARDFYKRANKNANFYVIDVEETTGKNTAAMKAIVNSYVAELRKLTNKKIGIYIANHLYTSYNLDMSKADFVWIPRYGSTKPIYKHQLWQFTDQGKVNGISTYVDLNKLNGIALSYFMNPTAPKPEPEPDPDPKPDPKPDPIKDDFFETNPSTVATKQIVTEYKSVTFNAATTIRKVAKNTVLEIADIEKTASGTSRLKLKNGNYVTANKKYVVKTRSNIEDYLTVVPKKVVTKVAQNAYNKVDFVAANKVATAAKNTVFTIADIDYTAGGTPRLKTVSGTYLSANIANNRPVINGVLNYIYINPKVIKTIGKVNVYTGVEFTKRTGVSYAKNKTITVEGIRWSKAGTPRLKLSDGNYITANKTLVQKK
ncbi:DUF5776 domain-containing protein [Kurthia sibirica]|nr:DUF5776 domain-containing protein [Kurthia sibirica]GEK33426.1 hypothetical protein KSI01_09590 [Kurthia sibirica]